MARERVADLSPRKRVTAVARLVPDHMSGGRPPFAALRMPTREASGAPSLPTSTVGSLTPGRGPTVSIDGAGAV